MTCDTGSTQCVSATNDSVEKDEEEMAALPERQPPAEWETVSK